MSFAADLAWQFLQGSGTSFAWRAAEVAAMAISGLPPGSLPNVRAGAVTFDRVHGSQRQGARLRSP